MVKEFWNERFGQEAYVYGTEPNVFFKQKLAELAPGKLLIPGAGEGRDAVYAAKSGWDVRAFDLSEAGKQKAEKLALQAGVTITYDILDAADYRGEPGQYDALAIVFFHLPATLREQVYPVFFKSLKPGGVVMMQLFHQSQLGRASGGPKDTDMLYLPEFATTDFPGIEIKQLEVATEVLDEGSYHAGEAIVTSLYGIKP